MQLNPIMNCSSIHDMRIIHIPKLRQPNSEKRRLKMTPPEPAKPFANSAITFG